MATIGGLFNTMTYMSRVPMTVDGVIGLANVAKTGNYIDLLNKPALFTGNYFDLYNRPTLSAVSASGSYLDLLNKPALFSGSYTDLTSKPTLFDGNYSSLTGAPTLAPVATSGSYLDLANLPTLFDGTWSSLGGKPTLFSGNYADLSGLPTLFNGTYAALTGKPSYATVATSGSYNDLINLPALFNGTWASLTGKPTFSTVATTGTYADLLSKPTLFDGNWNSLTNKPMSSVLHTVDQAVTNSTTLVDASSLSLPLAANSVYQIEGTFIHNVGLISGLKYGFGTLTNGSIVWQALNSIGNALVTGVNTLTASVASTGDRMLNLQGVVSTGATTETLVFRFAQNVANAAESAIIKKNSFIKILKIG